MYKLSSKFICIERLDNKVFLYNKQNKKKYLINGLLAPMLKSAINGINLEDYKEYSNEFAQFIHENIFAGSDSDSALYRKKCRNHSLDTIQIEITKRCNFSCIHCYLKKIKVKPDLSFLLLKKIVDQASAMGCINIDITGGEPLLHADLKNILQYIYDMGMKTTLFTNGYLIDDDWIAFFKSIYLDSVKISVDSIDECSHANIRKRNTLNTILSNIDKLIHNGIKVEVTTIAMKENLSEINDILAYFKEKQSDVIHYIDSYIPDSSEIYTDSNIITPEEYSKIICKRCKDNNLKKLSLKEHYCGFAYNYIFIASDGTVKLCPTMPNEFNIGNVNNDTIQFCWDVVVDKFYSLSCKHKNECKYYKYCAGGCRHRAYVFSGEIVGKDIYMCSFYKMMEGYGKND